MSRAGLHVPNQCWFDTLDQAEAFLNKHQRIVVKPARGEGGAGISVDIRTPEELASAIEFAHRVCETVLLEEFCVGEDLRIVVIDFEVVAAAIRRPVQVIGTGRDNIAELIRIQSSRRRARLPTVNPRSRWTRKPSAASGWTVTAWTMCCPRTRC